MEKIIGNSYVVHNNEFFIADIYEGNYYKLMEGGVIKTVALPKKEYDRVLAQYEERVKKDEMIISAYELNKKAGLLDKVSEITADPEAAEKEWYLRKHPQVVVTEEPKRKGIFGRKKKKKAVKIKCLECGSINLEGQKFCGECGRALLSKEDELTESKTENSGNEAVEQAEKNEKEVKVPDTDIEIIEIDEEEETCGDAATKNESKNEDKASESSAEEETTKVASDSPKKPKRRVGKVFLIIFIILVFLGLAGFAYFYFGNSSDLIFDSTSLTEDQNTQEPEVVETKPQATSYVVIRTKNHIAQNAQIKEEDLEGTILSPEQYEKYNSLSTFIDKDGKSKKETLLLWENKESVIGKYATKELTPGSILYDTSITTEHVVADKTYVDVEVDGESKTYETKTDVLPGNTKIQIIAVIQTDGEESSSVLLSELTLQDRSLESIFDSAGKDILEMLSEQSSQEATGADETATESADDSTTAESQGEQNE